MNMHKNARLTPKSREALVYRVLREGRSVRGTARAMSVSASTAYKWIRRYESEGVAGLWDRSSRPHQSPMQTSDRRVGWIERLRRRKWRSKRVGREYLHVCIEIEEAMTDNGPCYIAHLFFRDTVESHGVRQIFTRPYHPQTNGKAERFIRTAVEEWAYARPYHSSSAPTASLPREALDPSVPRAPLPDPRRRPQFR